MLSNRLAADKPDAPRTACGAATQRAATASGPHERNESLSRPGDSVSPRRDNGALRYRNQSDSPLVTCDQVDSRNGGPPGTAALADSRYDAGETP
jgi:hypothetical protein